MLKDSCVDIFDAISCSAAELFCGNEISVPFFSTGTLRRLIAGAHALNSSR